MRRAVGTEQPDDLTAVDAERDVGQHGLLVIGFRDRDDRQATRDFADGGV
jgi:hypothetical protein